MMLNKRLQMAAISRSICLDKWRIDPNLDVTNDHSLNKNRPLELTNIDSGGTVGSNGVTNNIEHSTHGFASKIFHKTSRSKHIIVLRITIILVQIIYLM